jgi:hypothetical protein
LGATLSWGLTISQNDPKIRPSIPQNIPIVIVVIILKLVSRSEEIVISSGFAGNNTNAKAIITA